MQNFSNSKEFSTQETNSNLSSPKIKHDKTFNLPYLLSNQSNLNLENSNFSYLNSKREKK